MLKTRRRIRSEHPEPLPESVQWHVEGRSLRLANWRRPSTEAKCVYPTLFACTASWSAAGLKCLHPWAMGHTCLPLPQLAYPAP